MNFLKSNLVLTLILLFSAPSAFPWGDSGHRITAELAQQLLNPTAIKVLKTISGKESLAQLATWPDEVRSDHDYDEYKAWHFMKVLKTSETVESHQSPKEGDMLSALQKCEADLLNPGISKEKKLFALRYLVHLMGDIHQPLHVTYRENDDYGGNLCTVNFFGKKMNIHEVWDEGMVERRGLSFTEYVRFLRERMLKKDARSWRSGSYFNWILESAKLRESVFPADVNGAPMVRAYCLSSKAPRGTVVAPEFIPAIGYEYVYRFSPLVQQRLTQGGVRLAWILNRILK